MESRKGRGREVEWRWNVGERLVGGVRGRGRWKKGGSKVQKSGRVSREKEGGGMNRE